MTLRDVVGWLVGGFRKKGAVRLGLFLLGPPAATHYIRVPAASAISTSYQCYIRNRFKPVLSAIKPEILRHSP